MDAAQVVGGRILARVLITARPHFNILPSPDDDTALHRRIVLGGLDARTTSALEWYAELAELRTAPEQPPPHREALLGLFAGEVTPLWDPASWPNS